MKRPAPYAGTESYIYISFSGKDEAVALPLIARMQEDELPLWFDDGAAAPVPWAANIADRVAECGCFIALLSEAYLASENCKDELSYARDREKPQILIYLEDVQLPRGMAMRMGRNQALFYDRYDDKDLFFEKLYEAQDLKPFFRGNTVPLSDILNKRRIKRRWSRAVGAALAVLLIAGAAGVGAYLGQRDQKASANTPVSTADPADMVPTQTETVLLDNYQLCVKLLGTQEAGEDFTVTLGVENKTGTDLVLDIDECYLNGAYCALEWNGLLAGGQTGEITLQWQKAQLAVYGLTPDTVTSVKCTLNGQYRDGTGFIEETAITACLENGAQDDIVSYAPDDTDVLIMDTPEYTVYACDSRYDEASGAWIQTLMLVNHSAQEAEFRLTDTQVNGCSVPVNGAFTVAGGCIASQEYYVTKAYWKSPSFLSVYTFRGRVEASATGLQEAVYGEVFTLFPEGEDQAQEIQPVTLSERQILLDNQWARVGQLTRSSSMFQLYWENLTEQVCVMSVTITIPPSDIPSEVVEEVHAEMLLMPEGHGIVQILAEDIGCKLGGNVDERLVTVVVCTAAGEELFRADLTGRLKW